MDHQGFAQLLGNYGEFVGAIAVVGTLIYLARQVMQSKDALTANTRALDDDRRLTRAQGVREIVDRWDQILYRATGTPEAASIFYRGNQNIRDLDEVEQVVYTSQLVPFLNHLLYVSQMAQEGLLDPDEMVGDDIPKLLDELIGDLLRSNPGARAWWEAIQFSFPHRDYVNELLKEEGKEANRWVIGATLVTPSRPQV